MILPLSGKTRSTRPILPRDLPDSTMTVSSLDTCMSHHLGCEGNDLHEPLLAQLARHGSEDAGADRLPLVVDDDHRVLVEADVAAVAAALFLHGAHNDGFHDVALLHGSAGDRHLHGAHDDVTDARVPALR